VGYGNYTAVPATATASCALDSIAVRYREHIDKSKSIITMLDCDARKSQSALPYIHPLPPDRADILGAYIIGLLNVSEPILMNRRLCRAELVRIMIKMCTCTDRLFIDSLTVLAVRSQCLKASFPPDKTHLHDRASTRNKTLYYNPQIRPT